MFLLAAVHSGYLLSFPAGTPVHARGPACSHSGSEELQGDPSTSSTPHQGNDAVLEEVRQSGERAPEKSRKGSSRTT